MTNTLKQNITDLNKMIENTKRITDDNVQMLGQAKDELQKLLEEQMTHVEESFQLLMKKMEERKMQIVVDFENKFQKEDLRFTVIENAIKKGLD